MQTILRLSTALLALGSLLRRSRRQTFDRACFVDQRRRNARRRSIPLRFSSSPIGSRQAGWPWPDVRQRADESPSDSFPGLLSLITGGSPRTTGVWYDEAFGHDLAEAKDCKPGAENAGRQHRLFGSARREERLDVHIHRSGQLVVDPATCKPIYPHSLLRVNTIFEVVKAAGFAPPGPTSIRPMTS